MQNAARVCDVVCHGGVIVSGSCNTTINSCCAGIVAGSIATCAIHGAAPVVCGSGSVFINNCNAARLGDITACGAVIVSGSGNVFIGG